MVTSTTSDMAGIVAVLVGTLVLSCASVSGEKDWCDLTCGSNQNTMCKYEEQKSTEHCKDIRPSMTEERRADLLKQHNEYRNRVAGGDLADWPKAADMRLLTWDDEMEESAQTWASQCVVGHDKCRRTSNFKNVGQNLLCTTISKRKQAAAVKIDAWTDEVNDASPALVNRYKFNSKTGHFTQVIWASTHKLGCGQVTYKKAKMTWVTLACNYGPSGNWVSAPMYTKGEPCTRCPDGTRCFPDSNYPNLCASEEEINSLTE